MDSVLDWDDGNLEKCQKHGVSINEIEVALCGTITVFDDVAHSQSEKRFIAIGRSATNRYILVVFTRRSRNGTLCIRPLSARYMHQKEIKRYDQQR